MHVRAVPSSGIDKRYLAGEHKRHQAFAGGGEDGVVQADDAHVLRDALVNTTFDGAHNCHDQDQGLGFRADAVTGRT